MKFGSQIALAVIAVIGVVAGITFVAQYQPTRSVVEGPGTPPPPPQGLLLTFPVTAWEWEPKCPSSKEFESHTPGHHDYWFDNPHNVPIDLGIKVKSCKCSSITTCVLTPEEAKRFQKWSLGTAIYQVGLLDKFSQDLGTAQQGLWGLMDQVNTDTRAAEDFRGVKLDWHQLNTDEDRVSVPAHGSGLVRLTWDGKKEKSGDDRLAVALWMQAKDSPREEIRLELPLTFVQALNTTAADGQIKMDDLGLKEEKTREFACWSSTLAKFPLTAREATGNPCITCSVEPLGPQATAALCAALNARVLTAYRVKVTVKERISDEVQMDLGPFLKRILLDGGAAGGEAKLLLAGLVRGDITVGSEEDNGRIILGSFPAQRGTSKPIMVTADVPGVELKEGDIRVEPETFTYLKVSLKKVPAAEGGKTRWRLLVRIPAGSPAGKLPEHSAVVLRMPGNPPRLIRIPVLGNSYQ